MPSLNQDDDAIDTSHAKHGLKKGRRTGAWAGAWAWALCAWALWAAVGPASALGRMKLQYTWGKFTFDFDSDEQRQQLEAAGFAPHNSTPFDVDVDRATGRVFMSFPRVLPGALVALATIKDTQTRDSPRLAPYPDWSWHADQRGCDGVTSVFRIYIDKCRRLWVIDCGVVDITNTFQHKCPPQLLVFDLRSDELIVRHRFDVPAQFNDTTFMLNVIAEQMGGGCSDDAYAYIADTGAYGMYVFSLRSQRSWWVASDTFRPESNAETVTVNGSTLTVQDGVLGLAQCDRGEYLYYHSFSSFQEGRVQKAVLREEALFTNGTNRATEEFKYIGRRQAQSGGEALTKNSVMFFQQMTTESIYCWDTSTEYKSDNHHVVEHDSDLLHFVTALKVISQGYPEEVWAIDNNGQRIFAGEFQSNQPNTVNIVKGSASDLSSKCESGWFSWIHGFCHYFWW